MQNRRRFVAVAVGIVTLFGGVLIHTPGVAAGNPAPGDEVIHYPFDASDLPGAQFVEEQGVKDEDGSCLFTQSGEGREASGPTVSVAREVDFTPSTCTHTLAEATYTPDTVPAAYQNELVSDSAEADTDEHAQPAVTVYVGQIKVNVEDPVQIDVSSTRAKVTWSGGSCVNSSHHYAYWGWYSPSGWQRTNASWAYDRNCSRAYTNVMGRYKNVPFCWPWTTYTNHAKTWFEGRPYGGWYWSYSVSKSGGCTSLLHFERIITTP